MRCYGYCRLPRKKICWFKDPLTREDKDSKDRSTQGDPTYDQPLVLPDDIVETKDLSFLEGRWRSFTELVSKKTNKRVILEYVFNADGTGITTVFRESAERCSAQVNAKITNEGKLVIADQTDIPCGDGSSFNKSLIICEVGTSGGEARCSGQQRDNRYDVSIRRRSWEAVHY